MFRILPHGDDDTPETPETLADAYARVVGARASITGDEVATLLRESMSPSDEVMVVSSFGVPFHVEPETVIIMLEDSDKLVPVTLEPVRFPTRDGGETLTHRIYLGSSQ